MDVPHTERMGLDITACRNAACAHFLVSKSPSEADHDREDLRVDLPVDAAMEPNAASRQWDLTLRFGGGDDSFNDGDVFDVRVVDLHTDAVLADSTHVVGEYDSHTVCCDTCKKAVLQLSTFPNSPADGAGGAGSPGG